MSQIGLIGLVAAAGLANIAAPGVIDTGGGGRRAPSPTTVPADPEGQWSDTRQQRRAREREEAKDPQRWRSKHKRRKVVP